VKTGTRIEETARLVDQIGRSIRSHIPQSELAGILDNIGLPTTATAMMIGMIPMPLGPEEGGEQNAPLGRVVIGGQLLEPWQPCSSCPRSSPLFVYAPHHQRSHGRTQCCRRTSQPPLQEPHDSKAASPRVTRATAAFFGFSLFRPYSPSLAC
jgi:hypothetical protein